MTEEEERLQLELEAVLDFREEPDMRLIARERRLMLMRRRNRLREPRTTQPNKVRSL